jgi:hypothetical protein
MVTFSIYWIILVLLVVVTEEPRPHHPPLFLTAYWWDPSLPGPNCNEDCSYVAIGLETEQIPSGVAAACPSKWLGLPIRDLVTGEILEWYTTRLYFPDGSGLSPRWCIDSFGESENREMVQVPWMGEPTWVYRIDMANDDLMVRTNQMVYGEWTTQWEPVPEEWYR